MQESNQYAGHFLSVIAFDGQITMNTHEAILLAQQGELRRTKGAAGLWQGWKYHAGEGIVRARNECADQFLRSPCAFHTFLDADLIPNVDHFRALRAHPEAATAIICGCYTKKQPKIEHCYNSLPGGNPDPNAAGLMEISKGGTGFMQIPRSAYDAIRAKFPDRWYHCDYEFVPQSKDNPWGRAKKYSYFFHDIMMDEDAGFMRDVSEDWAFCHLARQAGVKIYLDTRTSGQDGKLPPIWHRGAALYPLIPEIERLDLAAQLELAKARIAELEGSK